MADNMTGKQRILAALSGELPDRVPVFELYINEPMIVRIAKLLTPGEVTAEAGADMFGEERDDILDLYCVIVTELGLDATCTNYSIGLEQIDQQTAQDKFGTRYSLSQHGEPLPFAGPINSYADAQTFDMAGHLEDEDLAPVHHMIERLGCDWAHFLILTDPFKLSWRLRGGMENLLIDYALDAQLAHALSRITTDYDLAVIEKAAPLGVDVVIVPGDLAGETSLLMSPDYYREYLKPYHQEIVNCAHKHGLKIVKHSDGDIWPLVDDFLEVGFDGLHPIQPQCMDIGQVKDYLAGRACILGNIDCRDLLVFGSQEEVQQTVKQTIEAAAPGGGYIISSSNSIHPGVKPENYIAMVKAAHKYGHYDAL